MRSAMSPRYLGYLSFVLLLMLAAGRAFAQAQLKPSWKTVGFGDRVAAGWAFDTDRNRAVLFGGGGDATWELSGRTWNRCDITTAPALRNGHGMVYDSARHCTVLFGGGATTETWTYDGRLWARQAVAAAPPKYAGRAAMAYDERRQRTVLFSEAGQTWEWDGRLWTQCTPTTSPTARFNAALAYDGQRVVLFGGDDNNTQGKTLTRMNDTWIWDGVNWSRCTPAAAPPVRSKHALAYDRGRGHAVLFGGAENLVTTYTTYSTDSALGDTWEWDGATWTQCAPTSSPLARHEHVMIYDPVSSRTLLTGGWSRLSNLAPNSDLWQWDGKNWEQVSSGLTTGNTNTPPMAFDSKRGVVVMMVGYGSIWEWNGQYWTERPTAVRPSLSTTAGAMAYDAERGRCVVFGSNLNVPLQTWESDGQTWEWDGQAWEHRTPAHSPRGRGWHAMAYDAGRHRVVLFGGSFSPSAAYNDDTWEWDGNDWHACPTTVAPPPRRVHSMAYDTVNHRILLYGGMSDTARFDDLWSWDGESWMQLLPRSGSSTGLNYLAMTFDETLGRAVLVNQYYQSGSSSNTYEWNGRSSTLKVGSNLNTDRSTFAIVYDSWRGQTLIHGGYLYHSNPYSGPLTNQTSVYTSPELVVTSASLTGAAGGFAVRLSTQPTTTTLVSIARLKGDADMAVTSATQTLSFAPENWRTWQWVQVQAAGGDPGLMHQATFRVSAPTWPSRDVSLSNVAIRPNAVKEWGVYP